ncbi:hypothetical protein SBE55_03090 [Mycolicibacterium sp. 141076]|uniref:hypothetical protein n=1 Tax=Mycobacteriaceae TaxID=1762 RepID=UPI00299EC719|nr:hypothetical protein [Mycolicibacterium sp. 141076]MDX1876795.1 hypothetical protein [Mycolicibacterium sp. 141076]
MIQRTSVPAEQGHDYKLRRKPGHYLRIERRDRTGMNRTVCIHESDALAVADAIHDLIEREPA